MMVWRYTKKAYEDDVPWTTTVLSYYEILISLRSRIQEVCFKGVHSSRYQYKCTWHSIKFWARTHVTWAGTEKRLVSGWCHADSTRGLKCHLAAANIAFFSTRNRQRHSSAECRHSTAVSKRRVHLGLWRLGWWRALPPVLSHIYISYLTQRKRERNVINILVNAHMGVNNAPLILLSRQSAGQELLELQVTTSSQTLTYFWGFFACTCATDVRLSEKRMEAL